MNTLYDYKEAYLEALNAVQVDEETGEISGFEAFEKAEGDLLEKIEAVACYIKDLDAFGKALKAEADNLDKRAKTITNKAAYLRNRLTACMDSIGQDKYESPKCRVSFRSSKQTVITDEAAIPAVYVTIVEERKIDKNAIKAELAAGHEVSGASLQVNRNIQIK